jgi:hypothetical protein
MDLPGLPAHPAVNMKAPRSPYLDTASPANVNAANVLKGVVKSIPGTLSGIARILPGTSDVTDPLDAAAKTTGTAQAIGKGIGNAAQFLIPGGAEEKGAAYAASRLPMLGRYAAPLAKLATSAIGAGTVNKAQGGSFLGGAGAGAAGAGVGIGLKALASPLAETALGIRNVDRAFGRTPGEAILSETSGITPGTVAKQASEKVGTYSNQLDNAARQSNVPVDLKPARDVADSFLSTADVRNNEATKKAVGMIGKQLDSRGNAAIPQYVSPMEGLSLKRGVGDLKTSWNPATATDFSNRAVDATQHALHPELEAAIPGYRPLNAKISTLMPVSQRATAKDLNAGFIQRSIGRVGAHTGALVGGLAGYNLGGIPGAIGGIVGPEILASPEFQLSAARAINSPLTRKIVMPALAGGGLQLMPKKK